MPPHRFQPVRPESPRLSACAAPLLLALLALPIIRTAAAAQPEAPANPPAETASLESPIVGDIVFDGLKSWRPETVLGRLGLKRGEPYNALVLREDVAELGKVMRRVEAETEPMEGGRIRVKFTVEEFPRLRALSAVGNEKLGKDQIEKISKLKPGDALDENVLAAFRRALLEEYRKLGRGGTKVEFNVVSAEGAAGEADLQVVVQESDRVLARDLVIEGNEAFSAMRLRLPLQTKGSWLFVKNYYDAAAFDDDLALLRNFYHAHGYFDAVIEPGPFREEDAGGKKSITPVIRIKEGERYSAGTVRVRGARLFAESELIEPFAELEGKPFSGKSFARAMEKTRNLYYDHGFLTTEIKPENELDPEARRVNFVLQVSEKDRIYVGEVKVEPPNYEDGETSPSVFRRMYDRFAPPISPEAVKRDILLKPGEVFSKARERETLRRLDRLGIFTDAEGRPAVEIQNRPTANPRVHDAVVRYDMGATGSFGGGVGFGDVSGLFGYLNFVERNFLGDARDLRLQIQIGTRLSSASIFYLDRHYKGTDDSLAAALYYRALLRPGYEETSAGSTLELTRPLEYGWEGALRGRLEYVRLNERDGIHAQEDLNLSYPVATLRLGAREDTRYPILKPVEGRLLSGAVEAGWGGGPLLKFTGEAEYNMPLTQSLTYRFNPSGGLIPYSASAVGLTERFFLGGTDDLRGFRVHGAGLRDEDEHLVGVGGAVKMLVRNELFFPIVPGVEALSGVGFLDAGLLGESPLSYEMPRLSTGLGGRFQIRQAAIAVDFALPLLKGDGDQTQFVHFSFSSRF